MTSMQISIGENTARKIPTNLTKLYCQCVLGLTILVSIFYARQSRIAWSPVARISHCLPCDVLDLHANECGMEIMEKGSGGDSALISALMGYDDRCIVWIAFVGDSQLWSPFNHLVDRVIGEDFDVQRKILNQSNHHIDQRVCCRALPSQSASQLDWSTRCTLTRAYNTSAYVRDFFRMDNNTSPENARSLCLTWQFNTGSGASLRNVLADYTQTSSGDGIALSDAAIFAPQMVVVDPGLHVIMSNMSASAYASDIRLLMSTLASIATAQARESIVPTRFVYHDITDVVDGLVHDQKRRILNQTSVKYYNDALTPTLNEAIMLENSGKWLRLFPANRLSSVGAKNGVVTPHAAAAI